MIEANAHSYLQIFIRILVYGLFLFGITLLLFLDANEIMVKQKFIEHSWTEYSQAMLLFIIFFYFFSGEPEF